MTLPRSNYAKRLEAFPDTVLKNELACAHRGQWDKRLSHRIGSAFNGKLIFEIGCFDAGFLARVAANHPSTAFIGLDWKCKPLLDGAERIAEAGLRNIVLLRARAQDVRQFFADGEVDEAWIFHPDPCDKPAELKNRLITEPFLADVHAVLRNSDSTLAVKTDHAGYYQWMLALLGLPEPAHFHNTGEAGPRVRHKELMHRDQLPIGSPLLRKLFDVTGNSADFWNDAGVKRQTAGRTFATEKTLFEQRFIQKRLPIYFVELRKR